ncbi:MAG: hypothetical protein ACRC3H_16145 [Lachnospiraceae bacterium]
MKLTKIFLSYTLRDSELDKQSLKKFKSKMLEYGFEVYIDILDNDSSEPQKHVFKMLLDSNIICIIETKSIEKSQWVNKEREFALRYNIPSVTISYKDMISIMNCVDYSEFVGNKVIKQIMLKANV